jgi:UDP-N-acetylmuramate--alanine ligase
LYDHVHMVGIGGAGMAAIARVLLEMGVTVSGSDLVASDATEALMAGGAKVYVGHRSESIAGAGVVVYSTAIAPDNPEILAARAAGIPVRHRSDMLAEIMNSHRGIAVAGAHGKTTITAMLAWVLHQSNRHPTFIIGGELPGLGGARYGRGSEVVAEADESDRSFLRYRPYMAIVTSVEADHLENYDGSLALLVETFAQFLANVPAHGLAILCADDPWLPEIGARLSCRVLWYGVRPGSEYQVRNIRHRGFSTLYEVTAQGRDLGSFSLEVPGRHNVMNSLPVIAACLELGLEPAEVAAHLASFRGARRRFELVGQSRGMLVVDDYAHHPTEIKATLRAARTGWPDCRVIAVFQPHRYTRTHYLLNDFAQAFGDAHHVVLTEVYSPPPDKPIAGATGSHLAELVREHLPGVPVDFVPRREAVAAHLAALLQPGDIVITMGAGDIWRSAKELVCVLEA